MQGTTLIRFDWAIKKLLRRKANFKVLEGFLSVLLKDNIVIEQILESESNQEDMNDKFNRVDIIAENSKKEIIIIEVQVNGEADYFQRMLYGTSKILTEHIHLGDDYNKLRKVYSVNIVYFDLGQGKDYVYHGKTDFIGIHNNDKLNLSNRQKEVFNISELSGIFPEYYVIKVNQFDDIAKDSLDEWIYYLKNNDVKSEYDAPGLEIVKENLRVEKLNIQDKFIYNRHIENIRLEKSVMFTARDEGKVEGIMIGKIEGKIEGKTDVAILMINDGESNDKIRKYTGLDEDKINELRKQ